MRHVSEEGHKKAVLSSPRGLVRQRCIAKDKVPENSEAQFGRCLIRKKSKKHLPMSHSSESSGHRARMWAGAVYFQLNMRNNCLTEPSEKALQQLSIPQAEWGARGKCRFVVSHLVAAPQGAEV